MKQLNSYNLLGVELTPMTIDDLHEVIALTIMGGKLRILANHNLHSIYLYHHDPKMRSFYDKAYFAHLDGMSLVFLGKLMGYNIVRKQRVTYVDWIRPLLAKAVFNNWRIFYLGSKPGIAEKAVEVLHHDFPSLEIATMHGFFDTDPMKSENKEVIVKINNFRPHILMVGMGMPRQEHWILDNMKMINTNIILQTGACFDYVVGAVPTPPRWMGRLGLEWLFRLFCEPSRLCRRYLVEPWYILWLILKSLLRSAK